MAVQSEVDIMNSALRKLGAERILTPDDDSNRARLVKEAYPLKRDELLRSHPWRFNKAYASLAQISPKPDDVFDYDYVFQLPQDCARVYETNLSADANWEEIEGGRIACDSSEIKVKFGKYITDVSKFDANFVEVLAWAIAADIAYALTQTAAQAQTAQEKFATELRTARSYNAQVGSVKTVIPADDWVAARR